MRKFLDEYVNTLGMKRKNTNLPVDQAFFYPTRKHPVYNLRKIAINYSYLV